jgi:2',3'-cyclic-nucleotide 2'-phosphodiesterase (5'-nucleotidase family)
MGMRLLFSSIALFSLSLQTAYAVPVTLFHTNDLHSHFRPEETPLNLGGVAREKTLIAELRKETPESLLVDGGDWSEGTLYYTAGAGSEVLKLFDDIGYDVAIIGNHDWLNGPDTLLDAVEQAQPKVSLIASNFDYSKYPRATEFSEKITPYVIKEVNGVKIAFIGMATYEFIFNQFIAPIEIEEPFTMARKMSEKLRKVADAVVVISHNGVRINEALLKAAPEVDLVIGAHDHLKLTEPRVVKRKGSSDGWVVEAGCWGRYLGRVDLDITPHAAKGTDPVRLLKYGLTQIDKTIAEDPSVLDRIATIESHIETRMGPVFHDQIGVSNVELTRDGPESLLGDFVTQAYRKATGTQIGLDLQAFIYGNLHEGNVSSADAFNADPAVYNPTTGSTWNLQTLSLKGSILSRLIDTFLSKLGPFQSTLYMSGITAILPPGTQANTDPDNGNSVAHLFDSPSEPPKADGDTIQLLIDGNPVDPNATYSIAAGNGIIQTVNFINSKLFNSIPTEGVVDTGLEGWRVLSDSIQQNSPIQLTDLNIGNSIKTTSASLRTLYDDVTWTPLSKKASSAGNVTHAKISIRVTNYGASPSQASGNQLLLSQNRHGNNWALTSEKIPFGNPVSIPSLAPGESKIFTQIVDLTQDRGAYALIVSIRQGEHGEVTSDDVVRYFDGD